jgi:hypothetical protein
MKKVSITAKVIAYQTLQIFVNDEQYEKLKNANAISGEALAECIEDDFLDSDIYYGYIESEGLESASIDDLVESE